ncbi:COG4223 family protein [Oleomonas cavernae]|uniref:COG4223 family protein n=1 Tax=Oleomonas cavernae TaxID=2320859 RepID=UPI001F3DB3B4|nr:hypothetical protein [Oleomonas cavernae]
MTERPDQPGTPPEPRPDPVDLEVEVDPAAAQARPEGSEPPIVDKPLEDPPRLDAPYVAPPPARGFRRSLWLGVGAIVLIGAGAVLWHRYGDAVSGTVTAPIAAPSIPAPAAADDTRLSAVERAVAGLDRKLEALEGRVAELPSEAAAPVDEALEELRTAIAELRERQGVLEESFAAVDQPPDTAEPAPAPGGGTIGEAALSSRLASLEAKLAELSPAVPAVDPAEFAALQREMAALKAQGAETAQRVSAEIDRLKAVGRGVSLVYAIGRLRGAVAGSVPYAGALDTVRGHFEALDLLREPAIGKALETLGAHAKEGLPTRADLAAGFGPLARAAVQASNVPADGDLVDRLLAEAGNLVTVRPVGDVQGNDVAARVARPSCAWPAAISTGRWARSRRWRAARPRPWHPGASRPRRASPPRVPWNCWMARFPPALPRRTERCAPPFALPSGSSPSPSSPGSPPGWRIGRAPSRSTGWATGSRPRSGC